jgi:hypothetical protein
VLVAILIDRTPASSQVPRVGAATFTFWSRFLWPKNQTGFRVVATDSSSKWKVINSQSNGQMQENGIFSINSLGYGIRMYVWDATLANFYTRYIPFAANTPGMGQQFLLSPNQGGPVMAAWRFLAVRVDFDMDQITFFLDGRRALFWQVGSRHNTPAWLFLAMQDMCSKNRRVEHSMRMNLML